jgi:hypothetical protein
VAVGDFSVFITTFFMAGTRVFSTDKVEGKDGRAAHKTKQDEKKAKQASDRIQERAETWERLEKARREASRERERKRIQACVNRVKNNPSGIALPAVLLY